MDCGVLLSQNVATRFCEQHPPIVARLELGGDGTGT